MANTCTSYVGKDSNGHPAAHDKQSLSSTKKEGFHMVLGEPHVTPSGEAAGGAGLLMQDAGEDSLSVSLIAHGMEGEAAA
eukprot:1159540-Pelagomonas_calceolata.AAC.5